MKVYLHADDFGLTKKTTDDILECIDAGVINSVSVMVNGYAFEYAMEELKKREEVTISLHLNLDQAKSISEPAGIPLLTNKEGFIISSFEKLFIAYYTGSSKRKAELKEQVRREIKGQIEKFKPYLDERGLPLWIDSERCSHMIPFILEMLIEMAAEYRIDFIRIVSMPNHLTIRNAEDIGCYLGPNIIKHSLLNIITRGYEYKKKLREAKIGFTDYIFSLIHGSAIDRQLMEEYIKMATARNAGLVQVIFHPFKPAPDEMWHWDVYPKYKDFFQRKETGREKVYLLENKEYFNSVRTKYNG